jgi:hypothetical protein
MMRLFSLKIIFPFLLLGIISQSSFGQTLIDLSSKKYETLHDVTQSFQSIDSYYIRHRDRRHLFVKVYLKITTSIDHLILEGVVREKLWLEEAMISFAEEYRKAVLNYELKNDSLLPEPWKFDFDQSKNHKWGLSTQLLLSLNSHILHDLPIVLERGASSLGELSRFEEDYFELNSMFKNIIPELFNIVYKESRFRQTSFFHPSEVIKREVVKKLVLRMRKVAWDRAEKLVSLKNEIQKKKFIKEISKHTVYLDTLVLELDPFLSLPPGVLIPEKLRESTWKALSKIYEAIGVQAPETELEKDFASFLKPSS